MLRLRPDDSDNHASNRVATTGKVHDPKSIITICTWGPYVAKISSAKRLAGIRTTSAAKVHAIALEGLDQKFTNSQLHA